MGDAGLRVGTQQMITSQFVTELTSLTLGFYISLCVEIPRQAVVDSCFDIFGSHQYAIAMF